MKKNKKLFRNKKNRILGGVCSGIADYLEVDPTIIRLFWILGTLFWGAGLIAYLIFWIIMPEKNN